MFANYEKMGIPFALGTCIAFAERAYKVRRMLHSRKLYMAMQLINGVKVFVMSLVEGNR